MHKINRFTRRDVVNGADYLLKKTSRKFCRSNFKTDSPTTRQCSLVFQLFTITMEKPLKTNP